MANAQQPSGASSPAPAITSDAPSVHPLDHSTINGIRTPNPDSYGQYFGATMARRLLIVIVIIATLLWLAWWVDRPTLDSVREDLGLTVADTSRIKEFVDLCTALQNEHFNEFRNLSEMLIGAVFVPLFTLAAGWAFGERSARKGSE